MERPPGNLFLGETLDAATGQRTGTPVLLNSADLTTHGVIVGMTGSGKTGLGVVLIEEARLAGIPVLAIDPKGDLGNLCLTFPNLAPTDFEPWIDAGTARVQNITVADLATKTATDWRDGLASWGLGPADVATLAGAGTPTIYTPSSTSGVGLNLLGQLSAPSTTDPGARQDELDATVTGLLGLVGIESDPLSGREHVLIANLLARAWDAGTPLDLGGLLGQILDPPIRKLGVLDLDTFFPRPTARPWPSSSTGWWRRPASPDGPPAMSSTSPACCGTATAGPVPPSSRSVTWRRPSASSWSPSYCRS